MLLALLAHRARQPLLLPKGSADRDPPIPGQYLKEHGVVGNQVQSYNEKGCCRECLDRCSFWNRQDPEQKLEQLKNYYNAARAHQGLSGDTRGEKAGGPHWRAHTVTAVGLENESGGRPETPGCGQEHPHQMGARQAQAELGTSCQVFAVPGH